MNKCNECSKLQLTCCESTDIYVTNGDIKRISDYFGKNDFYHLSPVSEEMKHYYGDPCNVEEGLEIYYKYLFDEEGRRNILKRTEDNKCCFLTPNGCSLLPNAKPIVCRLYPYDWNDRKEIWIDAHYCPKSLFKDEQEIKEYVCLPEEEARRLVDLLYDELIYR
jgi:uncharacterized protein